MQRKTVRATVAVILTLCAVLHAQTSVSERVRSWIYKKLGIDPKIVQKFTAPKGNEQRRRGKRLLWVNLQDEEEHLLWACSDCWSPVMANDRDIAVLKNDGLWLVPANGQPRLAVPAQGLLDVLGRIVNEVDHLLVFQSGQAEGQTCPVVIRIADLKTGALLPADTEAGCIDAAGMLVHRDELWGTRKLSSTSRTSPLGPALELLVEDAATPNGLEARPLTPRLNARDSTRDRFDPIWRSGSEVVYLSNP